jgi:hypothetical protein
MKAEDLDINLIIELVERIRPILFGNPSIIQGAVLAELTATWLMGHYHYQDTEKGNARVRERMLEIQVEIINNLMKVKEKL